MSYCIGQYRRSSEKVFSSSNNELSFVKLENFQITNISKKISIDNITFQDFAIDYVMNDTLSYYLRFKVSPLLFNNENTDQIIYLKLKNFNDDINQQDSDQQLLQEYKIEKELDQAYFEIIISPNKTYNRIVWELQRSRDDYQNNNNGRGSAHIEVIKFGIVNNFRNKQGIPNKPLSKIGIQGPPLMLMCINREQIRIGKNGIYEINNGVEVKSIGFVPADNDYFIMDYEYKNE